MATQELMLLIKQKDQIEKQLLKLTEQIQLIDSTKAFSNGLVDREGFPRADLDFGQLVNYRNLKRRKAQLNNDHSALMKQIECKMFEFHATLPKIEGGTIQQQVKPSFIKQQRTYVQKETAKKQVAKQQKYIIDYLTPFAIISLVQPSSPASSCVKKNDLISQFGLVNIYTPDNIKQIPYQVKQNEDLRIVVMRPLQCQGQLMGKGIFRLKNNKQYQKLQLVVLPRRWDGRGLLGCKIDPI